MKHRVAELEGALLDAAVGKAEGLPWRVIDPERSPLGSPNCMVYLKGGPTDGGQGGGYPLAYDPSKNWQHGGPIIERESISVVWRDALEWVALLPDDADFYARAVGFDARTAASTPLIAAMRAFVISTVGDEVELP